MSRRPGGPVLVLAAPVLGLLLAGCGPSVTAAGVQATVDRGFTNLYLRQQELLGRPRRDPEWVSARSQCRRRDDTSPTAGAGDDWQCAVDWRAVDGTASSTVLEVDVRPGGCLTATSAPGSTGDPVLLVGGARRVNPIYQFDLCLPDAG